MNREEISEYDLGLPVPIEPLAERRGKVPAEVWARVERAKASVAALVGPRLREVRLFGSYSRNQEDQESDVDVLFLLADLLPGERDRVLDAVVTAGGFHLSPLILTVSQRDALRARELLIAEDIDPGRDSGVTGPNRSISAWSIARASRRGVGIGARMG
jgi:hypothetical protein